MVQHNENANPPTFFLTLDVMLQLMAKDDNVVRCGGGSERGGGKGRRGGGGGGGGRQEEEERKCESGETWHGHRT